MKLLKRPTKNKDIHRSLQVPVTDIIHSKAKIEENSHSPLQWYSKISEVLADDEQGALNVNRVTAPETTETIEAHKLLVYVKDTIKFLDEFKKREILVFLI